MPRSLQPSWVRLISGINSTDDCLGVRHWLWKAGLADVTLTHSVCRDALRLYLLRRESFGSGCVGPPYLSAFLKLAYGIVSQKEDVK